MTDILEEDLSKVKLPPLQPVICVPDHEFILDGKAFFKYLNAYRGRRGYYLWAMTYTYNPAAAEFLPRIERLVYRQGCQKRNNAKCFEIHTKMFILWYNIDVIDVFIGSQNLVRPTTPNLMVKIPPHAHQWCISYFDSIWYNR